MKQCCPVTEKRCLQQCRRFSYKCIFRNGMNRKKIIGYLECFSLFARSSFKICFSSHRRDCVFISSRSIRHHSKRHCHPLIIIIGACCKEQFGRGCELLSSLHERGRGCYDQVELC